MDTDSTPPDFKAYVAPPQGGFAEKFDILDKAAKKGDRWWFIALLMIGMAYVG